MFKGYKRLDNELVMGNLVLDPFNPDVLTPLNKKKTLEDVNLINE